MTILITWWLWYIWSHAAVVFSQAGYDVVIVDNLSNSKISVLANIESLTGKKIPFYEIDLRDKKWLSAVFSTHIIDGVIHFAGFKVPGDSCQHPFTYYDNNVGGGNALYEVMQVHDTKTIVFSSSCSIYDSAHNESPYDEHASLKTINPYASTKLISEIILHDLSMYSGFQTISLRYFNVVGAHPSGLLWDNPNGAPANVLPYMYGVLLGRYEYLSVWWNDYATPDGTGIRDYIHVLDLAEAHLSAYEAIRDGGLKKMDDGIWIFDVINLWTGKWTSVMELIQLTEKIMWKNLPYKICPRRPWDPANVYANPAKSYKVLWWKATRTVEDAIRDGWIFIQKHSSWK